MKIGVVGATGAVGLEFLRLLADRKFPVEDIRLFASERSIGHVMHFKNVDQKLEDLVEGCFQGLDLVFFSAGNEVSERWAPQAVREGAFAVDNSSAFRMNDRVALIVPEVNGFLLKEMKSPCLIANPNCSTIQLVVVLGPLQRAFGLDSVKVASYQAVSGAGLAGVDEFKNQAQLYCENLPSISVDATVIKKRGFQAMTSFSNHAQPTVFSRAIFSNCIPQIGNFEGDGFCTEEHKIMNETQKILGQRTLAISAAVVRVPVLNAHSEMVWVTLPKQVDKKEIIGVLKGAHGLTVREHPEEFPTALECSGHDPVFVGRIHQEIHCPKTWLMWIVADNLRKGAALNGIQIAEQLFDIESSA